MGPLHLHGIAGVVAVHGKGRDEDRAVDADFVHRLHHLVARDVIGPVRHTVPRSLRSIRLKAWTWESIIVIGAAPLCQASSDTAAGSGPEGSRCRPPISRSLRRAPAAAPTSWHAFRAQIRT